MSEVDFNMIMKSSTAIPCVVLDQNTINKTVLLIKSVITLTPIEPEVNLMGFCTGPFNSSMVISNIIND